MAGSEEGNAAGDLAMLLDRALTRKSSGDFDGAIELYTQAIAVDPRSFVAYFNRGLLRSTRGDIDGAIADYEAAIQIDPTFYVVHYNLGILRYGKKDFEGAIVAYSDALKYNPRYPDAYANRGIARRKISDLRGADDDLRQALAISKPGWRHRGIVETELAKVIELMQKAAGS